MKKNFQALWALLVVAALMLSACGGQPTEAAPKETGVPAAPQAVPVETPDPEKMKSEALFPPVREGEVGVWTLKGTEVVTPQKLQENLQSGLWTALGLWAISNPELTAAAVVLVCTTAFCYAVVQSGVEVPAIPGSILDPAALQAARMAPALAEAVLAAAEARQAAKTLSTPEGEAALAALTTLLLKGIDTGGKEATATIPIEGGTLTISFRSGEGGCKIDGQADLFGLAPIKNGFQGTDPCSPFDFNNVVGVIADGIKVIRQESGFITQLLAEIDVRLIAAKILAAMLH